MKYFIMIMACWFFNPAIGQNCNSNLSGHVIDFHDGTPLSGAIIYVKSINKSVVSNLDGSFDIENICNGKITIEVSHLGCDTKRLDFIIEGKTTVKINLEHHIEELHEVVIESHTDSKLSSSSIKNVLNTKTLEGYSSKNLGDALKEVSGVTTINTGNAIVKPVINGLHSSRILVITNGVRLQDQEWGIEHAPNVDINTAGSINVIKGANALAYGGDAIGGVIVLKPLGLVSKDSLYGKTITSTQTNGWGYSVNSDLTKTWKQGWYLNGQASLKKYGDFKAPDYYLSNTGMESKGFSFNSGLKTFEKGFNLYYSYFTNNIGILQASHTGNIEDLVNAINTKKPLITGDFSYNINAPRQDVTHQLLKADFYKRFQNFGRLELQYDFQNNHRFEYDVRRGANRFKPAVDLTLITHTLRSSLKLDSNNKTIYEFGLQGGYQNNFPNPDTGVRRLIPDYNRFDLGAFAISNIKWSEKTNLDFGFRYDYFHINAKKYYIKTRWQQLGYDNDFSNIIIDNSNATELLANPIFNYHNLSASVGLLHQFNDSKTLIINYGLSNRAPNPAELFSEGLHHSSARIEIGDLRIKQETSNRVTATYQFQKKHFNIDIEGFVNHINNYIFSIPTTTEQTNRGAFPVWLYQQTDALLVGVDLSAKYQLNINWSVKNNSAYVKSRDLNLNTALIDIPSFRTTNLIGYNNKKWLDFNIELQSEIVLQQNEYPNNNFEIVLPSSGEKVLVDISTPPPAYHLLHLKSDITFKLSHKTNLNVCLDIRNLLDTNYRDYLNRMRYFADDLGRNFMLQLKLNY